MSSTLGSSTNYLKSQVSPLVSRYPAGSLIEPHAHDALQILYANCGAMHVRTHGQSCIVNPSRAAIIPAGLEHEIHMRGQTEMATLYVGDLRNFPLLDGVSSVTVSPMMKQLLLRTIDRSAENSFTPSQNIHLLGLLFEEMQAPELKAPHFNMPSDRRASLVCEMVLADPAANSSLKRLASQVGACTRTINRIFRKELGISFCEWRQQVRISFAIDALHQSQSVSKIAFDLGYSTVSAFSYAFRKQIGISPTVYVSRKPEVTSASVTN